MSNEANIAAAKTSIASAHYRMDQRRARKDAAQAMAFGKHPGFFLCALASGLTPDDVKWVQQNLNFSDGRTRYLCAEWQTKPQMNKPHLFLYFPFSSDARVMPDEWLFDIDTCTFNPQWRGLTP